MKKSTQMKQGVIDCHGKVVIESKHGATCMSVLGKMTGDPAVEKQTWSMVIGFSEEMPPQAVLALLETATEVYKESTGTSCLVVEETQIIELDVGEKAN